MTSPQEALQKARELISDPKRWTQGGYAEDILGNKDIDPASADAVCFCAMGAIYVGSNTSISGPAPEEAVLLLHGEVGGVDPKSSGLAEFEIAEFNDTHTHAEVLAAFDRAIARASASSEERP